MCLVRNSFRTNAALLAGLTLATIVPAQAQDPGSGDAVAEAEVPPPAETGEDVSAMTVTGGNATALISYPVGTLLFTGAQACLEEGAELSLKREDGSMTQFVGPGCGNEVEVYSYMAESAPAGGTPVSEGTSSRFGRLGALRSGGGGAQMVVVRGSADALRWYPVGRKLAVSGRVCLPANARFVTFERLDGGGRVTYTGARGNGCDQTIAEPSGSGEQAGAGSGP